MNNFTKYFLGLLGTTVLSYQSTLQADPTSPQPMSSSNDTFLGKLGVTPRATATYGENYVKFSTETLRVNEGDGSAKVAVERSCSDKPLPVALVTYDTFNPEYYDAEFEVDYGKATGTLRWEANECGIKEFYVPIIEDREPEFDESTRIGIAAIQGTAIFSAWRDDYTTLTIIDNDADRAAKMNVLSLQQSYQLAEGASVAVKVERGQCSPHSPLVSVDVIVTPKTAKEEDYEISLPWSWYPDEEATVKDNVVTLHWGEAHLKSDCDPKYFYISGKQDTLPEPTETIELTIVNPSNGATLERSHSIASILDDDSSTIGFAQSNYEYEVEKNPPFAIVVERKNCIGDVPVAMATFRYDVYNTIPTVIWQENECGSKRLEVPIYETGELEIISGATAHGKLVADRWEVVSAHPIGKTDGTLIGFSQPRYNVLETASRSTINLERIGCEQKGSTAGIHYATYSGSALSETTMYQDYVEQSGNLSWEANECGVKSFTVPITQDSSSESSESLSLYLSSVTEARINSSRSYATLTIIDDDPAVDDKFIAPVSIAISLPLNTSDALDLSNAKAPLRWQVSDEHVVKVDEAGNITALAVGKTTITMTDAQNNIVSWQVTVSPKELTILTFQGDSEAKIGNYLDVKVNTKHVIPDHNQQTDLWIGIHLTGTPDDQLLYVTDSSHISSLLSTTPQPFKRGLQRIDNTYPILHFVVTPDMVGEYTLYAMLTESGKTPFEDAAQRSVLAIQTIKLH